MDTIFDKAGSDDYEEVIDFANYVFSEAHAPTNFPEILPKLYKREYFMDAIHYLARENGKIKAAVGAYPLELEFSGSDLSGVTLPGRGIGMVSVHPYSRSKGYMKELMNMALDDMRRDGIVFTCLGGLRQRYEYFGYSQTGSIYTFNCSETNIRHTLGSNWNTGLTLKQIGPDDADLLDRIHELHETKISRFHRRRDRLFDILSSWKSKILAVIEEERFAGYIIYRARGTEHYVTEINLRDLSRLPEVIGLFLRNGKAAGMKSEVEVNVNPNETEKLSAFCRFAEDFSLKPVYHFSIFNYIRFLEPFLKIQEHERNLADGSVVLQIEGGPRLRLAVKDSVTSIEDITNLQTQVSAELYISNLDAHSFFFSPLGPQIFPKIMKSVFLQNLLPLPLFFEKPDGI